MFLLPFKIKMLLGSVSNHAVFHQLELAHAAIKAKWGGKTNAETFRNVYSVQLFTKIIIPILYTIASYSFHNFWATNLQGLSSSITLLWDFQELVKSDQLSVTLGNGSNFYLMVLKHFHILPSSKAGTNDVSHFISISPLAFGFITKGVECQIRQSSNCAKTIPTWSYSFSFQLIRKKEVELHISWKRPFADLSLHRQELSSLWRISSVFLSKPVHRQHLYFSEEKKTCCFSHSSSNSGSLRLHAVYSSSANR